MEKKFAQDDEERNGKQSEDRYRFHCVDDDLRHRVTPAHEDRGADDVDRDDRESAFQVVEDDRRAKPRSYRGALGFGGIVKKTGGVAARDHCDATVTAERFSRR